MRRKMIALTGFIGSGKSTIASILRQWGYKTVDCDEIARQIADDPEVVARAARLLGEQYVIDGKLDRAAVRERVFACPELLNRYQALFFEGVRARIAELATQEGNVLFVEIPVIDAFPFDWDEVWCVQSEKNTLVDRVTARDGVTAASVTATLANQKPCSAPTRIICNNGSLAELERTLGELLVCAGLR